MRALLIMWFLPLVLFWGWYGLSINDWNMGTTFFSLQTNERVFALYGNVLGVEPAEIPGLAASACVLDSLFVLALAAFRWRAKWWPQTWRTLKTTFHSLWFDAAEENAKTIG